MISVLIAATSVAAIASSSAFSQSVFTEREWGQAATAQSIATLFGVFGFRGWLPQIAMLGSTIACVSWWSHLRSRDVTDATVIALSIWVFPRACVFATLWVTQPPVTTDFTPLEIFFVSDPLNISVVVIAICASIVSYGMAISRMQNAGTVLLVAVPFVAMSFTWNLAYLGHLLPIDVWFTMWAFAWALVKDRRDKLTEWRLPTPTVSVRALLRTNSLPFLLTLSVFVAGWWFGDNLVELVQDTDPRLHIAAIWFTTVLACTLIYFSTAKSPSQRQRWEWVGLVGTVAVFLLTLPTVGRIPNEIPLIQAPILIFPALILVAGTVCLALRKFTTYWPVGIASVWPALIYGVYGSSLFFSEGGSTPHIGFLGLLNLTAVTGITFIVIYFVFGPIPRTPNAQSP